MLTLAAAFRAQDTLFGSQAQGECARLLPEVAGRPGPEARRRHE